jgi:hypothetical protein
MATTPIYDKMQAELRAGELSMLERRVLEILNDQAGATVTRHDFIRLIFGYQPDGSLNGNKHDRKIRIAIKSLRDKGATFVVSSSGEAGYRIDTSAEKAQEMAGEMEKRARQLTATAERIRAALPKVRPPERMKVGGFKQLSFIAERAGDGM